MNKKDASYLIKRLYGLQDFKEFLKWLDFRANNYKDIGFEILDKKDHLIYVGKYRAIKELIKEIELIQNKKLDNIE